MEFLLVLSYVLDGFLVLALVGKLGFYMGRAIACGTCKICLTRHQIDPESKERLS